MFDKMKVSITVGGGLGDALMVYLADPKHHCDLTQKFPTSNHIGSLWFRRLPNFKLHNPDVEVILIDATSNPATSEFFKEIPYIDEVKRVGWTAPKAEDVVYWNMPIEDYKGQASMVDAEHEYPPIHWVYDYRDYEPARQSLYLSDIERDIVEAWKLKKGIACHPYAASPRDIMPLSKYADFIDIAKKNGYAVSILPGIDDAVMLDNWEGIAHYKKVPIHLSVALVLGAMGFIGTHSAMVIPAWYAGVNNGARSVVFTPLNEHFNRIQQEKSPVAFGFFEDFCLNVPFLTGDSARLYNMAGAFNFLAGR